MKRNKREITRRAFVSMAPIGFLGWHTNILADMNKDIGGRLVYLVSPEPANLATYSNSALVITQVASQIYDGLVRYNDKFEPIENLATDWKVADDGLSYEFELRGDIVWHDEEKFTGEDVAFSIELLKSVHPRAKAYLRPIKDVKVLSDTKVRIELSETAPYLMSALSVDSVPIIPKHIFSKGDIAKHPNASKPIGTGPFKFVEWKRGEYIRLEKNKKYWKDGLPYLEEIIVQFVPDASSRVILLEQGKAHLAGYGIIPFEEARRLKEKTNLKVEAPADRPAIASYFFNTKREPFNRREVRQALSYAVDREEIVEKAYFGFADVATGPLGSSFEERGFYTRETRNYMAEDRIEIANELLDEAGLPRKGDQNIRFQLTLDTGAASGSFYRRTAEIIRENYKKIGVKVMLRSEEYSAHMKRVFTDYDFDVASTMFGNYSDPALGTERWWTTDTIQKGGMFMNASRWSDPELDKLTYDANHEMDEERRIELYHKIYKEVVDAAPSMWIVEQKYPVIMAEKLHDVITSPQLLFDNMAEAWMEKK